MADEWVMVWRFGPTDDGSNTGASMAKLNGFCIVTKASHLASFDKHREAHPLYRHDWRASPIALVSGKCDGLKAGFTVTQWDWK